MVEVRRHQITLEWSDHRNRMDRLKNVIVILLEGDRTCAFLPSVLVVRLNRTPPIGSSPNGKIAYFSSRQMINLPGKRLVRSSNDQTAWSKCRTAKQKQVRNKKLNRGSRFH